MIEHPRAIRLLVSDLQLASRWYAQALQSDPVHTSDTSVSFIVGFCTLTLTVGPPVKPGGAAIYWGVDNVQQHFQRISALPHSGKVEAQGMPVAPGTAEVLDPFGNVFGLTFSETQQDMLARQQREAQIAALQNVRQTVDHFQQQAEKESQTSRRVFAIATAALALLVVAIWASVQFRSPAKPVDVRSTFSLPGKVGQQASRLGGG